MNQKLLVCKSSIVLLLLLSAVFSDDLNIGKHNVGIAAGFVTGYGLSYRQWFNKNGVQVTMSPYYASDSVETNFTMSFGVIGLRMLKEARVVNLFMYYGAHFWYSYDKQKEYVYFNPQGPVDQYTYTKDKKIFIGGGPGFDIHFWRLSFNLMFGIAFHTNTSNSSGINITGETGLYYSF